MKIPGKIVVDASIGIKLVINERGSDSAHLLLSRITEITGSRLYVPCMFFTECANVLWKYVRRSGYPAKEAQKQLANLCALGFIKIETELLLERAFRIAVKYEISVYDACYVAASEYVSAPLVTADERLAGKLKKTSSPPCLLDDFFTQGLQ